ncbi:MAG: hypothetical protein AAGI91_09715 [Bacteroidota bacterium]
MTLRMRPLYEIIRAGHAALVRELGVVDAIRFLNQYATGHGDYTAERHEWLGDESLEDLVKQAQEIDRARDA